MISAGIMLGTLQMLHFIFTKRILPQKEGITIPFLQMRTLRLREIKYLSQGHRVRKWQRWDPDLSQSDSKASSLHLSRYLSQVRVKPPFPNQGSNAQVGKCSDSGK